MHRRICILLVVGWLFQSPHPVARPQEGLSQEAVIETLRALGVEIQRDENAPGRPAIEADITGLEKPFTANDLAPIQNLQSLRRVRLLGMLVGDSYIDHLKGLNNLERISLIHTNVTDAGLERLGGLTSLRELHLGVCYQVTDRGLKHLGKLTNLEELSITDAPRISGTGLTALKGATKLRELDLSWSHVTDQGVEALADLPALETLCLNSPFVTDRCLESIRKMPKLKTVYFGGVGEITEAAVEALRKAKPALEVKR